MEHVIIGSGGGDSGSGRSPIDAPDSLRSREFTRIVDLISEGEIGGLVEGLKSVYFDGTPVENADNTKNFTGVTIVERVGTPNQTFVPGFSYAETETAVNTEVVNGTPIVRTISNSNVDSARVRLMFPALSKVDSKTGDSLGSSVHVTVEVQPSGGSYANVISDVISGKSTGKYVRQYAIPLTGNAPWNIRVTRVTPNATSDYEQNTFRFDSYSEVIDVKLRRPNLAAYYVQADSSQFSTVPVRSYKCYGRIIRVPSNYNEVTRTYTGIWDGTFKLAYSNCPPWVFMDLVTHSRYGLAKFIQNVVIDKWRLYEIAKYCDGMVDNGFGGVEPRYTVNMYIQTQQQAYALLNDLASAFESMPSYSGDALNLIQDAPKDAAYVYTPANVIDGKFQYAGVSGNAKHSIARVTFNDPLNHYKRDVVLVIDDDLVKKIGYKATDIVAVGCTSRGQANRKGRRVLYTEAVETETVTFTVGLDSLRVEPGQVFKVADPVKTSGSRTGGRLTSGSTTSALHVDAWTSPGSGATITVMMADGSLEKRNVSSVVGLVVNLATPLSSVPIDGAVWIANGSNATERYWRVLSITERTGKDKMQFDIVGLAYDPVKYAQIDAIGPIVFPTKPPLPAMAAPPANISFDENVVVINDQAFTRINVSWDISAAAKSYLFKYKVDNGNWVELQIYTPAHQLDIQSGTILYVAVSSIGPMGIPTPSTTADHEIIGENNKPAAPLNFALEEAFTGTAVRVKWDFLQRLKGYNILIRSGNGHPAEPVLAIGEKPDYSSDTSVLRSVFIGNTQRFEYSSELMALDTAGGFFRTLTVRIQSVGANGLRSDLWSEVVATNAAPAALTNVVIDTFSGAFSFTCNKPTERDYTAIALWMSTTSGFTPSHSTLVYDGDANSIAIVRDAMGNPIVPETDYYFLAAAYDVFGKSNLNYGGEIHVVAVGNNLVYLSVSSPIFSVNSVGVGTPDEIELTAFGPGDDDDFVFTTIPTTTLTGTGRVRTLAFDDMLTDSVIIEVTNGINTDRTTIFKLHDGADGVAGVILALSNEVHVLSAASNGTVASYASATTTVTIWRGTLNDTSNWDIDITPSSGVTASITYPGGIPTVAITDMTTNNGYVEISATRTGYDSPNPVKFTLAKSLAGNNGTNGTAGPPGANGQTTYLHIKYSNDGGTSFTANSGEDVGAYMGTYTDFTLADSNSPSAYTWALIRGTNGTNGTPGTPGPNGQSTYLHIKYSNDGGTTFTTNSGEDVGAYLGTYTDFTLADSTSVGDYTWALIKGANGPTGPAGSNGSPGAPGPNGQSTYLHIKYSNDGGSTFTANNGEDVGAYMGTYTDFTLADSNSVGAYTWALIRGANGPTGPSGSNGTPGTPGSNGQSTYLHIKYSNDGGGSFTTNNGEDVGAYMGTYTDFTLADSNSVGAYTWALIRGANGPTGPAGSVGTPGTPGSNGQSTYLHIKYSNNGGGSFTSNNGEDVGAYMGTYTDFTLADSNFPSSYTWALIKGADGTNGTPGTPGPNGQSTYLHIKYSNDGGSTFTASNGETPGAYMGTYTDFTLADSNSPSSYTWALIKGSDGSAGPPGPTGPVGSPPAPITANLNDYSDLNAYKSNGGAYYGSRTASGSGGTSPYTFLWSIVYQAKDNSNSGLITIGSTTSATVNVNGSGTDNIIYAQIQVEVTDAKGGKGYSQFNVYAVHGVPP